jgi:hypothetical protein
MKGGLEVLERIFGSLDEARHYRLNPRREIVRQGSDIIARRVIRTGLALGVQEFPLAGTGIDLEDLKGERIGNPIFDSNFDINHLRSPEKISHLYDLFRIGPRHQDLVLDYSLDIPIESSVFKVSTTFDSVCRDFDHRFTEELKPIVRYAIITPTMVLRFPNSYGKREKHSGYTKPTDGTAIVEDPFEVESPTETYREIFPGICKNSVSSLIESQRSSHNLSERVLKAINENPDFSFLVQHYVDLSKKIDEARQEEFIKKIRL